MVLSVSGMSTEFLRLYRELERITPTTEYDEKKIEAQRTDVMHRLGYKEVGGEKKYTKGPKFHGKKAREEAHEMRLKALACDSKAEAHKRMQIYSTINRVQSTAALSIDLGRYVKSKKPVPNALMRKMFGNDSVRKKQPNDDEDAGPKDLWRPPTIPRQTRDVRKDFTINAWTTEERALLNRLYLEIPKPVVVTKLDSWRNFYENVSSRFCSFYPKRTQEETIAKLQDLIHRRALKEVGEDKFWGGCRSPAKEEQGGHTSPYTYQQSKVESINVLRQGGAAMAASK